MSDEHISTLPQMVEYIRDSGMKVVLALDFEDRDAVEPAYWALKNLTNHTGVPANEWCIYKLSSAWYPTSMFLGPFLESKMLSEVESKLRSSRRMMVGMRPSLTSSPP